MKGILPDILSPRGPLLRSPGSGGMMALSTSPSTLVSSHVFNNYNYRDAGKLITKCMNEFARSMYLELQMVVFGAWVDTDRKKKWSLYVASKIHSLDSDHSTDLKAMRVWERTSQIS